jgi:hypothetical protein
MKDLPILLIDIDTDLESDLTMTAVSFVGNPAIKKNMMLFDEDNSHKLKFNLDPLQWIASGPAILADTPIYRNDKYGEYYTIFPKEVVKKLVIKMMAQGTNKNVNLFHSSSLIDGVTLFESFISDEQRGIKPMVGYEDTPDGSWFVSYKIDNPELQDKITSGEIKGFSVEGLFKLNMTKDVLPSPDGSAVLMNKVVEILSQIK